MFSVGIHLMEEKVRGKEGGQEHLVSLRLLFHLSNTPLREKKAETKKSARERERGPERTELINPESVL